MRVNSSGYGPLFPLYFCAVLCVAVTAQDAGHDGRLLQTRSLLGAVPGSPQTPDRTQRVGADLNASDFEVAGVGEPWNATAPSASPHVHAGALDVSLDDDARGAFAAGGAGGRKNGTDALLSDAALNSAAASNGDSLCALQLLSETSRSAPAFNWTLRWLEASSARPAGSVAPACGLVPLAEAAAHRGCSQLAAAAHALTLTSLLASVSGPHAASLAALASALTAGARGERPPGSCGSAPAHALHRILAPAPAAPARSADVLGHALLSVARVALVEGRPGASRAALDLAAALPGTGECVHLGLGFETRMLAAVRKAPTGPACAWCWGGSAGPGLLARVWDERRGAMGEGGCGGAEGVWAGMWTALTASARGEATTAVSAASSAHAAVVAALGASHEASLGAAYGSAVLAGRGGGAALVALRTSLGGAPSPLLRTLTLLASAALLPTERRARYAASAAGGEGAAGSLRRGHVVRAVAVGEAVRAQEGASRAPLLAASCPTKGGPSPSRLVCAEAAAAAALRSPAPTPLVEGYRAAAAEWAAVPHPLRTASAPFEAFSAAHALASFRASPAHGSLTWLEAGLLTAAATGRGDEGAAGTTTVIPLGGAVVYGAAAALSAAGAHAHAAAAFAAALAPPAAWDGPTRAALGGGWERAMGAWAAAGGHPPAAQMEAAREAADGGAVGAGLTPPGGRRVGGLAKLNVITAAEEEEGGREGLWGWATGTPPSPSSTPPPPPPPSRSASPPPARAVTAAAPPPPTTPSRAAALPPTDRPSPSDLDLSVRLSEAFLRFGMAVYGCSVAGDKGKAVKCAPTAHTLAPPRLAALFDPRGFEAPSSTNMLTPAGLAYLHRLLADVQAIEASGRGWELDVARTERDAAAYPYASVGMLIPVPVAPRAKGGAVRK